MNEFDTIHIDRSGTLRLPTAKANRYRKSFIPRAIASLTAFVVVLVINNITIKLFYQCMFGTFLDTPCLKCIVSVFVISVNVIM